MTKDGYHGYTYLIGNRADDVEGYFKQILAMVGQKLTGFSIEKVKDDVDESASWRRVIEA